MIWSVYFPSESDLIFILHRQNWKLLVQSWTPVGHWICMTAGILLLEFLWQLVWVKTHVKVCLLFQLPWNNFQEYMNMLWGHDLVKFQFWWFTSLVDRVFMYTPDGLQIWMSISITWDITLVCSMFCVWNLTVCMWHMWVKELYEWIDSGWVNIILITFPEMGTGTVC